jgi:hypothetical protein
MRGLSVSVMSYYAVGELSLNIAHGIDDEGSDFIIVLP